MSEKPPGGQPPTPRDQGGQPPTPKDQAQPGPQPGGRVARQSPDRMSQLSGRLSGHPLIRAGVYAWALVGLALAAVILLFVAGQLRLVVVPLILALFPAALLAPVMGWLRRTRLPPALAAVVALLGSLALLAGLVTVLVPQVAGEIPQLTASVQEGVTQLEEFIEDGPFGLDPQAIRDTIEDGWRQVAESDIVRTGLLGAAGAVAEIVAMAVLTLVLLFFYLKDGERIAAWLRDLFPRTVRSDAHAIGLRVWDTVGSYFRGQLLVALVDGVFIGLGLWILGVPLALPLGVLVFFGGLFPIVGAVITGIVAVLVALADGGFVIALVVLGLVVAVQQLESNILAPLVLGRATALHPLGVLTALTAGGILLGVLGAFIAVPVAASVVRGVGYVRQRNAARSDEDPATPGAGTSPAEAATGREEASAGEGGAGPADGGVSGTAG